MSKYLEALQKSSGEEILLPEPGNARLARPRPRPATPRQHGTDAELEWMRGWRALRQYWLSSTVFAAVVMATVLIITLFTKPVYEPTARVEIDPPGAELFSLEGRSGSDSNADYMETQARNMQSDQLLISVIRQLHLDQASEFTESGVVSRTVSGALSFVDRFRSWLWASDKSEEQPAGPSEQEVLSPREAAALSTMQHQLSVKRDTASRIISVSVASHDPVVSAKVTNSIIRSFIDRTYQTRHAAIMESTEWLSRQLDDIRAKMEQSSRKLAEFQRDSGIADVDENRSTFTEQMAELSRQKMQARAERIQLESYLNKARADKSATLPQIQSNQVVQLLTQKLGEARAELAQTLAVYGKNHPNAKRMQNQVDELESQIQLQGNAIVGQMQTSYAAALAREQMIDSQLRGTSKELGQMAEYAALKKEAQANADLYNTLYARVKEAGISAASKSINIRIVDQARVLSSPTRPRPMNNLGIGLLVALAGGVLLALVRQAMDTRIHTVQDVENVIGLSPVSMIPIAESNGRVSLLGSISSVFGSSRQIHQLEGPVNFLLAAPHSEQSEAFRGIYTSVMLSQPGQPPHVLLVASSLPGEGKTTVTINLAMTLAQQGKTCILDADFRRPAIARSLRVKQNGGLGDYLSQSVSLESVLVSVPSMPTLAVVAASKAMADPGRLITSENMRLLIQELRKLFDFVVIDSPPILPYADGRALAPFVDGVVFVGRAGVVTREAMARSIELLQEVHSAPVLEFVLNGAHTEAQAYGYGYKYPANP